MLYIAYMIYIFCMKEDEQRFTTIRISKKTFNEIFILKRNLELKYKKQYSYDDVISRLLEMYEGLKL